MLTNDSGGPLGSSLAAVDYTETRPFWRGTLAVMTEVTRILSAIEQGDPSAAEQLLPLVYDELRLLAAQRLAQEKPGQTLQATALVHEAYLRLVGDQHFSGRGHFFAAAGRGWYMDAAPSDNSEFKKPGHQGDQGPMDLHTAIVHELEQRSATATRGGASWSTHTRCGRATESWWPIVDKRTIDVGFTH